MAVYTVHEPPRRTGDLISHAERFVFVRDSFSWFAFLFGPVWMLRHRLWRALIGYLLAVIALGAALRSVGASPGISALMSLLLGLFLGTEAPSLRRWALERRGFTGRGVVVGDDLEAAERRFFDAWLAPGQAPQSPAKTPPLGAARPPVSATPDVIGLFPESGARR